jgi:hypothetical protein
MITFCSLIAFVCGMVVVYLFFRLTGIFLLAGCLVLCSTGRAVEVVNCTTNPVILRDSGGTGYAVAVPALSSVVYSASGWSGFVDDVGGGDHSINSTTAQSWLNDANVMSLCQASGGAAWVFSPAVPSIWLSDVLPSAQLGIATGFLLAGFGWAFRVSKDGSREF